MFKDCRCTRLPIVKKPGEYVCKIKLLKLQPLEQVTTLIQPFRK